MPPRTSRPLLVPLPPLPLLLLLLLLSVRVCQCAVEFHSAAGQHRSGLLAVTPLQTIPAGPTMARRAHCLALCVRRSDCASFNYGQLPGATVGCQLLGKALCESGGGYNDLQNRDAGVQYFDVYRAVAIGSAEVSGGDGAQWLTTFDWGLDTRS